MTSLASLFDQAVCVIEGINPLFQGMAKMLDMLSRIANQILKLHSNIYFRHLASISNSWYLVDIALISDLTVIIMLSVFSCQSLVCKNESGIKLGETLYHALYLTACKEAAVHYLIGNAIYHYFIYKIMSEDFFRCTAYLCIHNREVLVGWLIIIFKITICITLNSIIFFN
jgi:hypothetical protein